MLTHCGFLYWSPSVAEIDILNWTGRDHKASALHKKVYQQLKNAGSERNTLSQGRVYQLIT